MKGLLRGKGLRPYIILPHPALIWSLAAQSVHHQHPRILSTGVGRVRPDRAAGYKTGIDSEN